MFRARVRFCAITLYWRGVVHSGRLAVFRRSREFWYTEPFKILCRCANVQKRPSPNFGNIRFMSNFSQSGQIFLLMARNCARSDYYSSYYSYYSYAKNGPFCSINHRFFTGRWAFFLSTTSNWNSKTLKYSYLVWKPWQITVQIFLYRDARNLQFYSATPGVRNCCAASLWILEVVYGKLGFRLSHRRISFSFLRKLPPITFWRNWSNIASLFN